MMILWSLTAILCLGLSWPQAAAQNTYTAYFPKYIRPGFDIAFTISVFNTENPVEVHSVIQSSDEVFELRSTDTIEAGASSKIVLGSVPLSYDGSTEFTLDISGIDTVSGDEIFNNSTDDFVYASKALSIYIQTDKAIYQPGQTIKFRAVCLKPDLKPLRGVVTYQVQDPSGNIVLLEPDTTLSHGVAGGELSLTKDAAIGDWKITYIYESLKEVLSVTVKHYKLPKYKVELEAPSYIYPGSEGFTLKLTALYTYGKPVDGVATVKISVPRRYYNFGPFRPSGGSGQQQPLERTYRDFSGSVEDFITKAEIEALGWDGTSQSTISITGSVTETLTSTKLNASTSIDITQTNIKVETIYKPETIKPGLTYKAYIKVSEQDGKVLMEADRLANQLFVELTYRYPRGHSFPGDTTTPAPWYSPTRKEQLVFDIPSSGVVEVSLQAKSDAFSSLTFNPYTTATEQFGRYQNQFEVTRAQSPSDSFLQITTNDNSVSPGENAVLTVKTTEAINEFSALIISRGEIVENVTVASGSGLPAQLFSLLVAVTHEMIPSVQILASYVRSDGEIVADYLEITVSLALENQVSITTSSDRVDAGDDVSIRVQTSSAGSYVGARAIDQSVLLLKSGNDISEDRVVADLNRYSVSDDYRFDDNFFRWWWWYPRPSGAKDAKQVFENAGVIVLTDALLYEAPYEPYYGVYYDVGVDFFADAAPAPGVQPVDVNFVSTPSAPKPRSYFPETWLWDDDITGEDGSATFTTTAPDTITSWVLSAFSVSDEHGLGLAAPAKVTVFRNFFITLNLPLKITRGEIIIVQAVVFNYFTTDLEVVLTLTVTDNFELIIPGDNATAAGPRRILQVPSNGAVSVKFPLRIIALGEVPIAVSAVSELAGDALSRNVFVRPEGIQQCYSASSLINRESDRDATTNEDLEILIPDGIVPGSEKVKLFVYGDILGSTMNNLGRLLRTPSGCGEQNMVGFAPDVFVTLYLHQVGMLDAETREKAYRHFHDGYMNELKYKHKDGSYSAFGERDDSGSTWLTAFVAKCFIFARELRPELVENRIVDAALEFLIEQQREDGSFDEPGRVSHKAMQGGVNSPATLTAYVLITLRETAYPIRNRRVQEASERARIFLEGQLDRIVSDQYALAIVTYALHVAESSQANAFLAALEAHATVQGGFKYWHEDTASASLYSVQWRRPYYTPPTNDIEMTAYALLTYVRRDALADAAPVMKWLTSKQNDLGGYSSTQDTVIAVQALSKVAALLVDRTEDLTITATHSNEDEFSESFYIDATNSVVFHSTVVPPVDGQLQVSAEGSGIGIAQLSVCYNIPSTPYENEPYDCTLAVGSENTNSASVNFCCRLKSGDTEATGMFLFEIGLPNGFTVDLTNEEDRNSLAQLVELGDGSINVYYDQLEPGNGLCANIELLRYADVAATKPATITASDYYVPDKKVNRLYTPQGLSDTGACSVCGSECVGCPVAELSEWKPWTPCVELCLPELSTRVRDCVDVNVDRVVDISQCGLDEVATETRVCQQEGFPCPDLYDGLWYDLPKIMLRSYSRSLCRQVNGRRLSPTTSIPGSVLDGLSQYINCNDLTLTTLLNNDDGFTLSFLVKVNSFPFRQSVTFVGLGAKNRAPAFSLEKLWWINQLRLSLNFGSYRYRVRRIPLRATDGSFNLVGEWNHFVVTWNEEGALLYINGAQVGVPSKTFSRSRNYTLDGNENFYLGRKTYSRTSRLSRQEIIQGYLPGVLAGLNYWSTALEQDEVESLYSFYRGMLEHDAPEPLLSVRHLRSLAPQQRKFCFTEPSYLSALYSPLNNIVQTCKYDAPVPPFPGPILLGRPVA